MDFVANLSLFRVLLLPICFNQTLIFFSHSFSLVSYLVSFFNFLGDNAAHLSLMVLSLQGIEFLLLLGLEMFLLFIATQLNR
jgi:hypothetical protein